MDSERFDGLTKEVSRVRSRRRVLQALVASAGIGVLAHHPALADPGKVRPIRCFHRGDQCSTAAGSTPCCGKRLVCNPTPGGGPDTCQQAQVIG